MATSNQTSILSGNKKWIYTILPFLLMAGAAGVGYVVYIKYARPPMSRDVREDMAYKQSLMGGNPELIQNSFLQDVKAGVNDQYTKSDAYFITHRFFDNGGNVYEIYDYINSHPELAFMNEAEQIYPEQFAKLKAGTLEKTQTNDSLYVYLAYVETLEKHGYTDIAALSTLANQYSKNAFYNTLVTKDTKDAALIASITKDVERDKKKGLEYTQKTSATVADILDGKITSADMPARDILVGLNQYAAAVRYLKAQGIDVQSQKSPESVFGFAQEYANKNVPELQWFTSLLNATTLVLQASSSPRDVQRALQPILDFDIHARAPVYVVKRILNSKSEVPDKNGLVNVEMYSKRNAMALANKVPEFKAWLLKSGWTEGDLK